MKLTDFTAVLRPNARSRRACPKTHEVIDFLRSKGHKVYVKHHRWRTDGWSSDILGGQIDPKGGVTEIQIELNNGNSYGSRAECHEEENFNKKIGICVALGRAIKNIPAELILGSD